MIFLLRYDTIDHPRERDDLADVLSTCDPFDGALKPKAEAAVRHRTILAQIEVPLEVRF